MPYDIVRKFERTIAEYCGAKHGIAVSSCTNAIFLSLMWKKYQMEKIYHDKYNPIITIPNRTYVGVACAIKNSGAIIKFSYDKWYGGYFLFPFDIVDYALRFKKGMYQFGLQCLSFHIRKHIPIGRGGMILTNDDEAAEWLRKARFDGREEKPMLQQDSFDMCGWNMYMEPEQAARGLLLFDMIKDKNLPDIDDYDTYPDLSKFEVFK